MDPVLAAAQALVAIQSQVGRTLGGSVARVTVHRLEADSEPGTVPGRVSVEGTLRYRSVAAYRKAVDVLTKAARGAAMAAGARVSVSFGAYESFAASDPALVRWILPTARRVLGLHGLSLGASARQTPGFAVYAHQVSSALVLLGTHSNRLGTRRRLYTSTFDVDEECLSVGVHFLANVALDWLLEHAGKSGKKGRR